MMSESTRPDEQPMRTYEISWWGKVYINGISSRSKTQPFVYQTIKYRIKARNLDEMHKIANEKMSARGRQAYSYSFRDITELEEKAMLRKALSREHLKDIQSSEEEDHR